MSTEINDIADLVRILEEQPEWASRLRTIILGQELMELPAAFRQHREETRQQFAQVQEQFRLVNARIDRLEVEVAEIRRSQTEMAARMASMENRIARMEERQERMEGRQEGMESRQERMESRQERMESRQEGMDKRLADLDGMVAGAEYEVKVIRNLRAIARDSSLHRIRSLFSRNKDNDQQLDERLDQAVAENRITEDQALDIQNSDVIAQAQDKETGQWVYVAIEASRTVRTGDVERAARRAELLEQATQTPTVAAVFGAEISEDARRQAAAAGVTITLILE